MKSNLQPNVIIRILSSSLITILFSLVSLLAVPYSLYAEEEILSYVVKINLQADSLINVEETITVNAEGHQIIRGIYRDIPARRRTKYGFVRGSEFEVLNVTRNGRPENYVIENISGGSFGDSGFRIRIGNADINLEHGVHTYSITYTASKQVDYFDKYDQLYWNVTGNGWVFPIKKAKAILTLPSNVPTDAVTISGYTGAAGSKEQSVYQEKNYNELVIGSTRELFSNEGLTLLAEFPKGFIYEPTKEEQLKTFLHYNFGSLIALLGVIIAALYYYYTWSKVGKDPSQGTIIPRFSPPDDLSVSGIRYLDKMGFDQKAFTAEIIDIAVKGYITIEQSQAFLAGTKFTIKLIGENENLLTSIQKKLINKIFYGRKSVELDQSEYKIFQAARDYLHKELQKKHLKTHFNKNKKYFFIGAIVSIVATLISLLTSGGAVLAGGIFISIWLSIWSVGVFYLVSEAVRSWQKVFSGDILALFAAILMSVISIPFIGGELFGFYFMFQLSTPVIAVASILHGVLAIIFYKLLKAPTVFGRKIMDQIDGFKMYLGVAEKDTLRSAAPHSHSLSTFEKFLPYALALDLESKWSEKFADVIAKQTEAATNNNTLYRPSFYSGQSFANSSAFSSSFSNSFSSALSSASSSPRSSGGSGGSGGGGGGGGGGGW